jgi:hypothetical protein
MGDAPAFTTNPSGVGRLLSRWTGDAGGILAKRTGQSGQRPGSARSTLLTFESRDRARADSSLVSQFGLRQTTLAA